MTTALGQYSWSLCTKRSIFMDFFTNAVRGLAKSGYHFDILEKAYKMEVCICFKYVLVTKKVPQRVSDF